MSLPSQKMLKRHYCRVNGCEFRKPFKYLPIVPINTLATASSESIFTTCAECRIFVVRQVTPITGCRTVDRQRPRGRTLAVLVFSPSHSDVLTHLFNFSWTWRAREFYHCFLRMMRGWGLRSLTKLSGVSAIGVPKRSYFVTMPVLREFGVGNGCPPKNDSVNNAKSDQKWYSVRY